MSKSLTLDPRVEYLPPEDCADRLGAWATPHGVRRLAAMGVLPSAKLGRSVRILVTADETAADSAFYLPRSTRLFTMQELAPRLGLTYRGLRMRVWKSGFLADAIRRVGSRILIAVETA